MAFEAKYFALDIESEQRGQGAWDRNAALKLSAHPGTMNLAFETKATLDTENGTRKRRLRRAGSQIAQQGIWEGILGGVVDVQDQKNTSVGIPTNGEENHHLPTLIVEEAAFEGFGMDLDDRVLGLFEGMIFYTWGFTDVQVFMFRELSQKLEENPCRCDYEEPGVNVHQTPSRINT